MNSSVINVTKINQRVTVIIEEMPWINYLTLGFVFETGSRDEDETINGITHFIEHMTFKGAEGKTAYDIARILENLGAFVNGYTSKEEMAIYGSFLKEKFSDVFSIIISMFKKRKYDEKDFNLEKKVILQEISEIFDEPEELLSEFFLKEMFPQNSLGLPVAGSLSSIENLTKSALETQLIHNWSNKRICISIAGNIESSDALRCIANYVDNFAHEDYQKHWSTPVRISDGFIKVIKRNDLKQIYGIIGSYTISFNDPRRYVLAILNHVVGASRSSRLVSLLQEEKALVSYISSFYELYSDIGIWGIFFITNSDSLGDVLRFITEELKKLKNFGITKREMDKAVSYRKGLTALSSEDSSLRMRHNARNFLKMGVVPTLKDILNEYDKLTVDKVNAELDILNIDNWCGVIMGPIDDTQLVDISIYKPIKEFQFLLDTDKVLKKHVVSKTIY
ncbi:MAG: insulinase family protein [candidate division WOR-3 bacterium]|nr:insulinase family protein [candidate division WOR-3 bacterium]